MHKALSVAAVLLLAAAMAWPQHGRPGAQPGGHGASGVPDAVASGSVYDTATAVWAFNDPADLGAEARGTTALDLTEVNTPTATGGALGYAAALASGSSQYADAADNATTSIGSGVSWGFAAWITVDTSDTRPVLAKGDAMDTEGDFDGVYTLGGVFTCRLVDSAGAKTDTDGTVTAGAREFVACRYNATTNELEAGEAGGWSGSATSTASDGADLADKMTVGAHTGGGDPVNGVVGPVLWYRSASGGDIFTDAIATSLYNSGKGKTCADLSDAEKVNLVSCWEMSEDGGPYLDSIGSNTLTAVNTPTRAAGLVERSDSGMAVDFVNASSQYLTIDDNAALSLTPTDSATFTVWTYLWDVDSTDFLLGKAKGTPSTANTEYTIRVTNSETFGLYWSDGTEDTFGTPNTGSQTALIGSWVFIAARLDNTTDLLKIRINDGADATLAWAYGTQDGTGTFTIGRAGTNNASYYNSAVDNAAFWKRALTDDELAGLYDSGAGDFYAAYWDAYFSGDPIRFAWSQMPEIRRVN